jgi:GntR family transcriptional regulator
MTNRSLDLAAADLRVRRGSVPASTQLAEALQAAIVKRRLPRGGRLPSAPELIDHTGLSRLTVRAAVGLLERQGCKRVSMTNVAGWSNVPVRALP